jgi:hypothetical protein
MAQGVEHFVNSKLWIQTPILPRKQKSHFKTMEVKYLRMNIGDKDITL